MIDDPECVIIDTRNDYEVEIGTFYGAVDPKQPSPSESFHSGFATTSTPSNTLKSLCFVLEAYAAKKPQPL